MYLLLRLVTTVSDRLSQQILSSRLHLQAFKEARDVAADAAKRVPGGTTAENDKEVARVLRCVPTLPESDLSRHPSYLIYLSCDASSHHMY